MIRMTLRAAAALALIAAPAAAHVTFEKPEAPAGSTYKAVVRVPHGCGDKATHTLRIQIPEGFINVKPMPKAGWTLETVVSAYATPHDEVAEGVTELVWSGGNLPNEWYDEFVFRGKFSGSFKAGDTVFFSTVQECEGAEEAWIDTSGNHAADMPAPSVTLTPAEAKGH